MSGLISCIGWTLIDFLWQGALIGCATALGLLVLRNGKPEQRYLLACSALLLCLLWPAFECWSRVSALQGAVAGSGAEARLFLAPAGAAGGDWLGYLHGRLAWIVVAWAVCAAALALRMAAGLLWIRRVATRSRSNAEWQRKLERLAAQCGVTRAVRLRIVDNLASPVTAGWWRPVVLVPASLLTGMAPHLLEALLAHEMAHVRRVDYLVNLAQNVVETLLFYHPAVWWISNRIRAEREQIADDLAARTLGEPRRLALALSELERFQFSTHHLAQAANGGDLMSRIKRLVRPDTQALNWKAAVPVLGLAAALLAGCANTPATPQPAVEVTRPLAIFNSCKKPMWPEAELRAGHQGTVGLSFLVSKDGKVLDSKVLKSSGYPAMDEAARSAIEKCSFRPGTRDGVPVEAWMQMQYVWTLQ